MAERRTGMGHSPGSELLKSTTSAWKCHLKLLKILFFMPIFNSNIIDIIDILQPPEGKDENEADSQKSKSNISFFDKEDLCVIIINP